MDDPSTTAVRWDILSGCGHGFEFVFASLYSIASRTTTLVCTVWVERNTNCWHENMMGSLLLLRIAKLLLQHAFTRWNCRVPAMAMDVHICKSLYYCIIASRDDTWASQAGTNFLQPRDITGKHHLGKRMEKKMEKIVPAWQSRDNCRHAIRMGSFKRSAFQFNDSRHLRFLVVFAKTNSPST